MLGRLMLSSATPSPVRMSAPTGSPAIPPHTPTQRPAGSAARSVRSILLRTAGWSPSACGANVGWVRSMARTYCVRSFVPIEKKSASRASSGAMSAAEGTSIMMPISTGATPASRRTRSAISRAARTSSMVATIGSMIFTGPSAEERVLLLRQRDVGHDLVAADVERAEDERPAVERVDHRGVGLVLLVLAGSRVPVEEQELGAHE